MNRTLSVLGVVGTVAYLLAVCKWMSGDVSTFSSMKPNEVGDFVAGIFGPLAIYWLILGFFQQGIELRQNTRALELQSDELRHSVEQQKDLVEVSRQQVKAEIEALQYERDQKRIQAQPKFIFSGIGGIHSGTGVSMMQSTVTNTGNTATEIVISTKPSLDEFNPTNISAWLRNADYKLQWKMDRRSEPTQITLKITYRDALGALGTRIFRLVPKYQIGSYPDFDTVAVTDDDTVL